jgi:hypothetical protein
MYNGPDTAFCDICSSNIPNCNECDNNANVCLQCTEEYFINGTGQCVTDSCRNYDTYGNCIECNTNKGI